MRELLIRLLTPKHQHRFGTWELVSMRNVHDVRYDRFLYLLLFFERRCKTCHVREVKHVKSEEGKAILSMHVE